MCLQTLVVHLGSLETALEKAFAKHTWVSSLCARMCVERSSHTDKKKVAVTFAIFYMLAHSVSFPQCLFHGGVSL